MDVFDSFFSGKVVPKGTYDGLTYGHVDSHCDDEPQLFRTRRPDDSDYMNEYINNDQLDTTEAEDRKKISKPFTIEKKVSSLEDIEELTDCSVLPDMNSLRIEDSKEIYKKFPFERSVSVDLPVMTYRDTILEKIEASPVVIIRGPTGCGKTTQVPQFVLDECWNNGKHCNIVVTQPRRIAAINIATRVCKERNWELGSVCGYKIGLADCTTTDTRLQYVTTGTLLNMIISKPDLNEFTHIFVDEVHERAKDMDFLLLVIKRILLRKNNPVKVILMSATMDANKFAKYFRSHTGKILRWDVAPIITIETEKSRFRVDEYFLDDLTDLGEIPYYEKESPMIATRGYELCVQLIRYFERFHENNTRRKAILIFLPGIFEIEELHERLLNAQSNVCNSKWEILCLHSSLPSDELKKVFAKSLPDVQRIILSTNIAESSVTIVDVGTVIDFCLTKQMITDPLTGFSSLQLIWSSHNNCIQRSGRVGRVAAGRVYRFIPRELYAKLDEDVVPEMLCSSLESIILQAKLIDMGEPKALLSLALDPPNLTNIETAVLTLKEAGGLTATVGDEYNACDGDLTPLGNVMAQLPVDIHVSKLIFLGYLFGVLDSTIVIGAAMSNKSVFKFPLNKGIQSYDSLLSWASGSCSDHLAFLHVYHTYKYKLGHGDFNRSDQAKKMHEWARQVYLEYRVIREIELLVEEIKRRLNMAMMEDIITPNLKLWSKEQEESILKLIIAGAFYPHYFIRDEEVEPEEMLRRKVVNKDPFSSVYLTGFPLKQPGKLYEESIKKLLRNINSEMNITVDCTKVVAEFPKNVDKRICYGSSRIPPAVYRAVRLRGTRTPLRLPLLLPLEAESRVQQGIDEKIETNSESYFCISNLPGLNITCIRIKKKKVLAPDHFFAENFSCDSPRLKEQLQEAINIVQDKISLTCPPKINNIYLARLHETSEFVRVRVDALNKNEASVFAIDTGEKKNLLLHNLKLPGKECRDVVYTTPAFILECRLAFIHAPLSLTGERMWSQTSLEFVKQHLSMPYVYGDVFSVVEGVVRLIVYCSHHENPIGQSNLNELLVSEKLAVLCHESHNSLANHRLRERNDIEPDMMYKYELEQHRHFWVTKPTMCSPNEEECCNSVNLRGPFSPLEVSFSPLYRVAERFTKISISSDSVNAVVLDDRTCSSDDYLLISSFVHTNPAISSLKLHHTTMFSKIPGITSLVSLMFAPRIQLRTNSFDTRYVSALCGLGADSHGSSLYPEHDYNVIFPYHIDDDDIDNVNIFRSQLNDFIKEPRLSQPDLVKRRQILQEAIVALITKVRPDQKKIPPKVRYSWQPSSYDLQGEVYSPVEMMPLVSKTEMLKNLSVLSAMASRELEFSDISCALCNVGFLNLVELRSHLATKGHKSAEGELNEI